MPRATLMVGSVLATCVAAGPRRRQDLQDLYFGEALYYANQGHYFEALERLDAELAQYHGLDEPQLDSLHYHSGQAEFSVGDFELNYRMHHRAGRAIRLCWKAASMKPCATRRPFASRASISRKIRRPMR